MTAAERWEEALSGWGFPDAILDGFDGDPWQLTPDDLAASRRSERRGYSPADIAALEALPRRGTVLDVGCGTGEGSAALRKAASLVVGVDPRPVMLERFTQVTTKRPLMLKRFAGDAPSVTAIEGRWPDVAGEVQPADVVVCHHVLYDVGGGVADFVAALSNHARRTVVLVLTQQHPLAWLTPYIEQLHGLQRPSNPTAEDAADLVREVTGNTPAFVEWTEHLEPPADVAAFERMVARRCAVGQERLYEVGLALHRVPLPDQTRVAALVWHGAA